jgi:hypothetical protein
MAIDDPHHVQFMAALLSHSNLTTGERYAFTLDAARRHQKALRRLREAGEGDCARSAFACR